MAPNLAFEQQQMTLASNDIQTASQDLAALQRQMSTINADLSGAWSGMAHTTFTQVYAQFEAAYVKMNTALNQLGEDLAGARNVLVNSDNTSAATTGKVAGLINTPPV